MNIDKSDKEIENDFTITIEEDQFKKNLEADNDLDIDSIQYTINNTKRDYHNTSGLSLLKELEDKWEMIEKNKFLQTKVKQCDEGNFETNAKSYIKINYKALINEAKNKFLIKCKQSRKTNEQEEFEAFVNKKIKELRKYQYEPETNQYNLNQQQQFNQEIRENNNIISHNYWNQAEIRDSKINNKQKIRKSFLKEDPKDNGKRKEISSRYRGNLFNCNEKFSIEGLVYESPNTIQEEEEEDKEDYNNQPNLNKIMQKHSKENLNVSLDLMKKMKNVFEEISTLSIASPLLSQLSNQSNSNNADLINLTKQEIVPSMNFLDRNFHDILQEINPSLNNRVVRKIKTNTQIEIEDDKYFSNLTKEAGYVRKRTKSDSEGILSNVSDKKLSKKLEENVKLLNNVLVTEKIPKMNYYHSENNSHLNLGLFNNNNKNNSNYSIYDSNHNKICSKNKFDDCISKIYQANAVKINKLLKTAGNNSNKPNKKTKS